MITDYNTEELIALRKLIDHKIDKRKLKSIEYKKQILIKNITDIINSNDDITGVWNISKNKDIKGLILIE